MRTILLSILMLSSFLVSSTPTAKEQRCAQLANIEMNQLDIAIQNDLTTGVWYVREADIEKFIQFYENGVAEIIAISGKKRSVENRLWSVATDGGIVYLFLHDEKENMNAYYVHPDCDGMQLEDMFSGSMTRMDIQIDRPQILNSINHRQLQGFWQNPFLQARWNFNDDGSFAHLFQDDTIENGIWELSRDGNYIVLYFTKCENPERVFKRSVLKIEELNFEDLSVKGSEREQDCGIAQFFEKI